MSEKETRDLIENAAEKIDPELMEIIERIHHMDEPKSNCDSITIETSYGGTNYIETVPNCKLKIDSREEVYLNMMKNPDYYKTDLSKIPKSDEEYIKIKVEEEEDES